MFPALLRFAPPQTIIQVGAHTGDDGLIDACRRYGHRLIMFEPIPQRAAELGRKIAGAPSIEVVPMAVSTQAGRATFNIANHDDCSSLQEFDEGANQNWVHQWHPYKRFDVVDRIEVEVVRLDDFLAKRQIGRVDFLLVDAQGEDLRVVESLGTRMADVRQIQIEVNLHHTPLYKNSFGLADAVAYFDARNFFEHVAWKQSMNREANLIFRNRAFYPHPIYNRIASVVGGQAKVAYYNSLKLPRVLAVTKMMIARKLGLGAPRPPGRGHEPGAPVSAEAAPRELP